MFKRVMVAVIGIPALLGILSFAPEWATLLLVIALCGVGAHELMHAVTGKQTGLLVGISVSAAVYLPVRIYYGFSCMEFFRLFQTAHPDLFTVEDAKAVLTQGILSPALVVFPVVLCLFFYSILHYGKAGTIPFAEVTAAIFAGLVFPLMLSCLLWIRLLDYGQLLVWTPLAISFGSDTFALFAGMLCGRHKLAPHVSPKKTVEGGVGGLLGGVIGLALLKGAAYALYGMAFLAWWQVAVFGVLGSVISQIGDLSFSVIKREFGVKDYGRLLPGHGGVLDRFDSVTFVAPFAWLVLSIL